MLLLLHFLQLHHLEIFKFCQLTFQLLLAQLVRLSAELVEYFRALSGLIHPQGVSIVVINICSIIALHDEHVLGLLGYLQPLAPCCRRARPLLCALGRVCGELLARGALLLQRVI